MTMMMTDIGFCKSIIIGQGRRSDCKVEKNWYKVRNS